MTTDSVDPVVVVGGWVMIDGCKVARIEPGGVIAFPDKCRRRVSQRGRNQVRVKAADLMAVIEASEK